MTESSYHSLPLFVVPPPTRAPITPSQPRNPMFADLGSAAGGQSERGSCRDPTCGHREIVGEGPDRPKRGKPSTMVSGSRHLHPPQHRTGVTISMSYRPKRFFAIPKLNRLGSGSAEVTFPFLISGRRVRNSRRESISASAIGDGFFACSDVFHLDRNNSFGREAPQFPSWFFQRVIPGPTSRIDYGRQTKENRRQRRETAYFFLPGVSDRQQLPLHSSRLR